MTLILSALAAGALKGTAETAPLMVKDAYTALRSAVAARFSSRPTAEAVLVQHEEDPAMYEKPLAGYLREAGVVDDPRVIALAQALMRITDEDGHRTGKYQVNLAGAKGSQVGDNNTQNNTFN